jgi:hypothetical protein
MESISVGTRVKTKREIDRFPHFKVDAGKLGTVDYISDDELTAGVKMDDIIDGAAEWDNCILWGTGVAGDNAVKELLEDCEIVQQPAAQEKLNPAHDI